MRDNKKEKRRFWLSRLTKNVILQYLDMGFQVSKS